MLNGTPMLVHDFLDSGKELVDGSLNFIEGNLLPGIFHMGNRKISVAKKGSLSKV